MVDVIFLVVTQAKELLYIFDVCWNRLLLDGLKLGWISMNRAGTDNVPQGTQQITGERNIYSVWHKDIHHKYARGLYGDG